MNWAMVSILAIPLLGTTLGAACVFFLKKSLPDRLSRALTGFAAGVMVAASIWSLILPAMDQAETAGQSTVLPAAIGVWAGVAFLLVLDRVIPHLHGNNTQPEGPKSSFARSTMLTLAVTLHNIPEGMAVGVVLAGAMGANPSISQTGAMALALGIALQNFPEGAILSLPLHAGGQSKARAFRSGLYSGMVEPIAAGITLLASDFILPVLPYLLCFAAGAMLYVVVEELIPDMSHGNHSNIGTLAFTMGFTLMLVLDVALG